MDEFLLQSLHGYQRCGIFFAIITVSGTELLCSCLSTGLYSMTDFCTSSNVIVTLISKKDSFVVFVYVFFSIRNL